MNFLEIFFPIYCAGCKKESTLLCDLCRKSILPIKNICIGCQQHSKFGYTHAQCLYKNKYLPTQLIYFGNFHDPIVQNIIHEFKYEGIKSFSKVCAALCKDLFLSVQFDLLTYIPLHKHKQNVRGFNQSELFAKELGGFTNIKPLPTLQKIYATSAQMGLDRAQRLKNINGSFKCIGNVQNQQVLLIDDVCTTGSTLRECTKVLLKAGAKNVTCFVFARD